jgi:hypothetical protein
VIDVHFIVERVVVVVVVVVVATESAVRFCFVLFIIIFDSTCCRKLFRLVVYWSKIVSSSCFIEYF